MYKAQDWLRCFDASGGPVFKGRGRSSATFAGRSAPFFAWLCLRSASVCGMILALGPAFLRSCRGATGGVPPGEGGT